MRQLDYPFYKILGITILGILAARYLDIELWIWCLLLAATLGLVLFFYLLIKTKTNPLLTFFISLAFLAIAGLSYTVQTERFSSNHFNYTVDKGKDALLVLHLYEQLGSNQYNHRFYATVRAIDGQPVAGNVLVLFKRSDSTQFKTGDLLTVYDDINEASNGRNPGDFNYKEYLQSIDVYGQVYVDLPKILSVKHEQRLLPWYERYRNILLQDLEQSNLTVTARSMIEALVLGQRQNIDPTITKSFRDAGVIHILALSGLHVGIILLILQFATRWLHQIKYGKPLQTIIVIALLWCFALLTGMSSSILRAVTMFSFVAIGLNINLKQSVFHSLAISAFLLLCYDPRLLFQVGFQLSYIAVISIVLLQPLISRLLPRIPYWLPRKLWQVTTVTLAAQIGVAPLSAYYFHQLPMAFLIGNLCLLLFLPLILGLSIAFIVFLRLGLAIEALGEVLNLIFDHIIDLVSRIASWETWVWNDLYPTVGHVVCLYVFLIGLVYYFAPILLRSRRERFIKNRSNYGLHVSLLVLIIIATTGFTKQILAVDSFLVLHQSRGSAVAISNGEKSTLYTNLSTMDKNRREQSLDRLSGINILTPTVVSIDSLPPALKYKNHTLIVIGKDGTYVKTRSNSPIVLLSYSPKVNLDQLITRLQPRLIIADGSNYPSNVKRWETTCNSRGVPFKNTYDTGAISLLPD